MPEKKNTIEHLPKFVLRSISATGPMTVESTLAILNNKDPRYSSPKIRQEIMNDALDGKVSKDTWPVLYFAYRVSEKSKSIRAEKLDALRTGLLEYVKNNPTEGSPALQSYMKERVDVLDRVSGTLRGTTLQGASEHSAASQRRKNMRNSQGPRPG